jgi:integrase
MEEKTIKLKDTLVLGIKDQYRILTPSEYEILHERIPKTRLRILVDILMFTGMRYRELEKFSDHLTWFDPINRAICLPAQATKTKRERTIHLTPQFTKELNQYLREYKRLEVPAIQTMQVSLARWKTWATPKTFRKSWESWLLFAGYDSMKVALSQGHTQTIQLNHYANMSARLKSESEGVKKYTEGWGV